jgi:hypothetical protein
MIMEDGQIVVDGVIVAAGVMLVDGATPFGEYPQSIERAKAYLNLFPNREEMGIYHIVFFQNLLM